MQDFTIDEQHGIAHLRLCRPQAANALRLPFWSEFPDAVRRIDRAGRARVLVISGEGRHFCGGMDTSVFESPAFQPDSKAAAREAFVFEVRRLQATFDVLATARIPVIAAIQGACVGAGLDMVSACDLRFAAPDAYFRIEEINIGMMADVGSLQRLPHLLPDAVLRRMAFCGATLDAARAAALGFVNAIETDVVQAALAAARAVADRAPLAVAASKVALNYARDHSVADGLAHAALLNAAVWHTPDIMEAMRARAAKSAGSFAALLEVRGNVD